MVQYKKVHDDGVINEGDTNASRGITVCKVDWYPLRISPACNTTIYRLSEFGKAAHVYSV